VNRFLSRLGDRINPIVVKESRQAVNSRIVAAFLLLFLTVEMVVMLLLISEREVSSEINMHAGREIFSVVQGVLLGTCMILIPTMTGARLAGERSDVNVDLLFISSLSPRAVLFGKLAAAGALALLIFSAAAPFMTFAYVLRGLDLPTIFLVLLADYLAVLLSTSFLLFLASIPATRGLRILLGVGGIVAVVYMGGGLLAATNSFLTEGGEFDRTSGDFWLGVAGLALLILATVGLFFVWSVALISPPAANRAHTVRLYTAIVWLLECAACAYLTDRISHPRPMMIWGLTGTIWFSLQMLIATSERDGWGPRVARTIPRSAPRRALAFLFYSGAGGGLLFGALGCLASIAGMVIAMRAYPSIDIVRDKPVELTSLIAAYTYCYCLSGILVRRLLAKSHFRIGFTWLLSGILFGLGSAIPFILAFAIFDHHHRASDELWFYFTSPLVTVEESLNQESDLTMTATFLCMWGGAVTVANLPWLMRQVLEFRRREKGA